MCRGAQTSTGMSSLIMYVAEKEISITEVQNHEWGQRQQSRPTSLKDICVINYIRVAGELDVVSLVAQSLELEDMALSWVTPAAPPQMPDEDLPDSDLLPGKQLPSLNVSCFELPARRHIVLDRLVVCA